MAVAVERTLQMTWSRVFERGVDAVGLTVPDGDDLGEMGHAAVAKYEYVVGAYRRQVRKSGFVRVTTLGSGSRNASDA